MDDIRQGADPRLPLELALVKVTRPQADLSRESLAHRVELLESRGPVAAPPPARVEQAPAAAEDPRQPPPRRHRSPEPTEAPSIELSQVAEAWDRSILDAVRERSIPVASLLTEATPTELSENTLTLEFPAGADFHRRQVGEPQNIGLLRDALYEVTGRSSRSSSSRETPRTRRGRRRRGPGRGSLHRSSEGHVRRPRGTGGTRVNFDMNKMLKEAQRMQEELAKAQEEAATEVVEASAGGGMVTVKANGAGDVVSITIDPRAIDPDDPELLADLVLAAVNEALRSARSLMESKMSGLCPGLGARRAAAAASLATRQRSSSSSRASSRSRLSWASRV